MRIAYLVDVHDHFDAVPQAMSEIGPVDLLIVGGDITTAGTADDAERAVEEFGVTRTGELTDPVARVAVIEGEQEASPA